ncbi:MocR-like pyridoxine biosynthesis transcription factor PdxR [Aristophania vespae]|uniref:MocR-like pyridoxine biosynthesis transcription factor PdxR n=1 Tax=Aristophania vespae TaxID=2697033 RepID=UPI00235158A1|nr:PLP-dependent aminotransferase family protein [Aristophania vespae]UMM64020.1 HTH-type transcriptional regulatory protein GabR [Aristophania vespae]
MKRTPKLPVNIDRNEQISLSEQIRKGVTDAISKGLLAPGARLPSWLDLAAQLGVSRGTVKSAYDRLKDDQLVASSPSQGTRVAPFLPEKNNIPTISEPVPNSALYRDFLLARGFFQMGIPAKDNFPATSLARLFSAAMRARMSSQQLYPDPRGEIEFRTEIAAQLALSRGLKCHPSQIFITSGFTGALSVILQALKLHSKKAWVENPGFPPARKALELAGLSPIAVPVDHEGMNIEFGVSHAKDAALALVTAGQQAPLGVTLSLERRAQLLNWADQNYSWIIEDDYLGELQLNHRAAPALASLDSKGRVIYTGTFSKTISPNLRLGFLVVPPSLIDIIGDIVATLSPAPEPALQMAIRSFMHEGHFLRHLRKMKRLYHARSHALCAEFNQMGHKAEIKGLSILLQLPETVQDETIISQASHYGLAPSALSCWYMPNTPSHSGLLLGLADPEGEDLLQACKKLDHVIRNQS